MLSVALDFEFGFDGVAGVAAGERMLVAVKKLVIVRPHQIF
jgi:hypothetical protein